MNLSGRVASAVKAAGCTAYLRGEDGDKAFQASIQPAFYEISPSGSVLGSGDTDRFNMYTGCEDTAMEICRGGRILYQDKEYDVRRIETVRVGGENIYRKARLRMREEYGEGGL